VATPSRRKGKHRGKKRHLQKKRPVENATPPKCDKQVAREEHQTKIAAKRPARSQARLCAEMAGASAFTSAAVVVAYSKAAFGDLSLMDTVAVLTDKVMAVRSGDMNEPEAILTSQAAALNAIFAGLARKAAMNLDEHPDAGDRFLRLALKAQSQCRSTLETLSFLKNPPVLFARQTNIAHGPQQINGGIQQPARLTGESPRAGDSENEPIKLMEPHDESMDIGAANQAGERDSKLATLGVLNRTTKR
jgi:hypothetical protein